MLDYFATLPAGKTALWCYLFWYVVTVFNHFDPAPAIWLNAVGLSILIGVAIRLSVGNAIRGAPDRRWQVFRFFLIPFCVSSFAALIKGRGFYVVVPPTAAEAGASIAVCISFIGLVGALKLRRRRRFDPGESSA
jgi:hypothetical protein